MRREQLLLVDDDELDAEDEHDADEHDDDAQAQVETGLLGVVPE